MKLGEELNARARSRALLAELSAGGDTTNRVSQCDAKPDPLVANPAEVSKPQSLSRIRRSHAVCALGAIRTRDTRFRKPTLYPLSYEGGEPVTIRCRSAVQPNDSPGRRTRDLTFRCKQGAGAPVGTQSSQNDEGAEPLVATEQLRGYSADSARYGHGGMTIPWRRLAGHWERGP